MPSVRGECKICKSQFIGIGDICDLCFLLKCHIINKIERTVAILESLGYQVVKVNKNDKEVDDEKAGHKGDTKVG